MAGKWILPALLLAAAAACDPIDTAYDLLEAIEYGDGHALETILTADLYGALDGFMEQARAIAQADPALAEDLLRSRYGSTVTLEDLENLTNQEIMGLIMGTIALQPEEYVERETASMEGREATVVIHYFNGSTISFRMNWENGDWRVSDSSLMGAMFR